MKREHVFRIRDCPNELGDQIFNSLIMAGDAFFASLIGMGAVGVIQDWKVALLGAGISAGFTFFSTLAIQRKLKKG